MSTTFKSNSSYLHTALYNDFVVCAFTGSTATFVHEDVPRQSSLVGPSSEADHLLAKWYTRQVNTEKHHDSENICYCRMNSREPTVLCSNPECPIAEFHFACIFPAGVTEVPKTWYSLLSRPPILDFTSQISV